MCQCVFQQFGDENSYQGALVVFRFSIDHKTLKGLAKRVYHLGVDNVCVLSRRGSYAVVVLVYASVVLSFL